MSTPHTPFPTPSFYEWVYDILVEMAGASEEGRPEFLKRNDPKDWVYKSEIKEGKDLQMSYYRNENMVVYTNPDLRCYENDLLIEKINDRLRTRPVGLITKGERHAQSKSFCFVHFGVRAHQVYIKPDNQHHASVMDLSNIIDLG